MRAAPAILSMALCLTAGCTGYVAGDLLPPGPRSPPGARLDCLDVAVTSHAAVFYGVLTTSTLVQLGNRCTHPVPVHFERLRFTGTWPDGTQAPLAVYDPRHELHAALLEGGATAGERLILDPPTGRPAPASVCADLTHFEARLPEPLPPLCMSIAAEDGT